MTQLLICCLALLLETPYSKEFTVPGTDITFVVDQKQLDETPKWDPERSDEPLTAGRAIKIAKDFHQSVEFKDYERFFTWKLLGASLVKVGDDQWYWVVQYHGEFNPSDIADSGNVGAFSYIEDAPVFLRYPVLLNGKLPRRLPVPEVPAAFILVK